MDNKLYSDSNQNYSSDEDLMSIDPSFSQTSSDSSYENSLPNSVVTQCHPDEVNPAYALYPLNPNSKTCKFTKLNIISGTRKLSLTENESYFARKDKNILEVVAGVTRDKKNISIVLEGAAGPCEQHTQNIKIHSSKHDTIYGTTNLKYQAASIAAEGYLNRLWPKSMKKHAIRVVGKTCGHLTTTNIIVYPDASWDIALAFKYDKVTGKFKFEKFEVKHKYDGIDYTISLEQLPTPIKNFIELLHKVLEIRDGIKQAYRDLTGDEKAEEYGFHITYPSIEFSGKWGWEENPDTTLCKYPVNLKFKLDPLIDLSYKKDILEMLISKWPGVGSFINYVRTTFDSFQLKVDFEIKGSIAKSIEISFDLAAGEKSTKFEGNASLNTYSVSFSLSGSASIDLLVIQGGGVIEGSSSFSFDFVKMGVDEKGAYIQYPVTWSGLEVKGMIYVGSSLEKSASKELKRESKKRGEGKQSAKIEKVLLKLSEKTFFEDKIYVTY
jgi:hypothetical protein